MITNLKDALHKAYEIACDTKKGIAFVYEDFDTGVSGVIYEIYESKSDASVGVYVCTILIDD